MQKFQFFIAGPLKMRACGTGRKFAEYDQRESVHSAQYGFISGRSSTSQLLSTLHSIGKDLYKGLQTDVVFMDISKAFDTVDHSKLLQKLCDFGLSGSLLLWFGNYLSGRCQRVIVTPM
jgi:hypothetical protein